MSGLLLLALTVGVLTAADGTVATAVYANVGHGYRREKGKDGAFKPEYYALSNGGRIYGTTRDLTVDRVTYPEVAEIAVRLLAQENYHYAQSKDQATLLLVLQWGNTIGFDRTTYGLSVDAAASAYAELVAAMGPQGPGRGFAGSQTTNPDGSPLNVGAGDPGADDGFETAMLRLLMDNRVRDQLNERNAKVLGYMDDLADANDIRRWAGGGDRYTDLIGDVEESRYYIVVSAYDFPELLKHDNKKLLWQTRVSVRTPGNRFDDSFAAMLKGAARYFGQDSGRLIRGEESKGVVELGDLKFLGEAKEPGKKPAEEKK
ncbi:hypothetical protein Verru16b_01943 [Lacunisphaera limnophila]|uniref:Uncharacterized protein n=1 Tax=Lacunisphaera limnophila TaxID=1838286 RepID=A0A1D8AVE4_9BACT|nr:hypothetical protein Verru16b_01943 [Lacunisphaera limnophila]